MTNKPKKVYFITMNYLVLDLEMTGTEPGWHEIIQIGACIYTEHWELKGTYLQNVYPENEEAYSESAYAVHGLSLEDLKDAPMIYDVLPAFEEWILEKAAGPRKLVGGQRFGFLRNTIICGQSVINDINFMKFAYRNEKLKWPFSNKLLDLHTLSYFLFRVLKANGRSTPKSLSLGSIAAYFGYEREGEIHNALEDAELTADCFKEIFSFEETMKIVEAE